MDLSNLFMDNNSIILSISSENYMDILIDTLSQINEMRAKVGYVSMSRLLQNLRKPIIDKGLNLRMFFFVDSVTKSVMASPQNYENCIYVNSPNDLTKTSIAVTKMLKRFGPDFVVFDSISSLLIYEDEKISSQFLHSMVNKVSAFGAKSLLLVLPGKKEEVVIKKLSLVIDKIIHT